MRKAIYAIVMFCMCSISLQAQYGIGAGVLYGSESELGFTGRVNYDINAQFSVYLGYSRLSSETVETPFFGETTSKLISTDIDVHYHFGQGTFSPYALAGLNRRKASTKISGVTASESEIGANVGVGTLYQLADKINLFGEAKYVISEGDQLVVTAGAMYSF